jgi:hypothetical protein
LRANPRQHQKIVMAGLDPAIHVFLDVPHEGVDARDI